MPPRSYRYSCKRQLQPPGQTLLDELGPDLGRMEVPDLGVGARRLHSFKSSGIRYIKPDLPVAALKRVDMQDIRCAPSESADYSQVIDPAVATFTSPWVYFRCRKPGPSR